jgi:hypothetical protein
VLRLIGCKIFGKCSLRNSWWNTQYRDGCISDHLWFVSWEGFISSLNLPYEMYCSTVSYIFYTWSYITVGKTVGAWGYPIFEIKNAWDSVHIVPTRHNTFAETNLIFTFKILYKNITFCLWQTHSTHDGLVDGTTSVFKDVKCKTYSVVSFKLGYRLVQTNSLKGTQLYPLYTPWL